MELAFVGRRGERRTSRRCAARSGRHYLPNRIVAHGDPGRRPTPTCRCSPARGSCDGRAALYVCRDFACQAPVTDAAGVAEALSAQAARAVARRRPTPSRGRPPRPRHARGHGGLRRAHAGAGRPRVTGRSAPPASCAAASASAATAWTTRRRSTARPCASALDAGCNLIDTSTNYTDGGSERLVGEVLAELLGRPRCRARRSSSSPRSATCRARTWSWPQEREAAGPALPRDGQVRRGRLALHPPGVPRGPARALAGAAAARDAGRLPAAQPRVLPEGRARAQPRDAREAARGVLPAPGARPSRSSKARPRPAASAGTASPRTPARGRADDPRPRRSRGCSRRRAQAGGAGHHFRVLQLPLNLFESGAALERNNGPDLEQTVLETPRRDGVGVLVNRPLNAMAGEGMVRLADVAGAGAADVDFEMQLAGVAELEAEYRQEIAAPARSVPEGACRPSEFFRWSADLERHAGARRRPRALGRDRDPAHPAAAGSRRVRALDQALERSAGRALAGLARPLSARAAQARWPSCAAARPRRASALPGPCPAVLDPLLPASAAARRCRARRCGWRRARRASARPRRHAPPAYVDDALGILPWPPLPDAARVYEAMRAVALPA